MKAVMTMAVAAALATAAAWGAVERPAAATADAGYRKAVLAAFDNAKAGLAESPIPEGVPVAVLPIAGDSDGWLMGLANGALTGAGKNCVVGKEDPLWDTIIEEIEWDERKGRDGADILDEETIDHFGRLQSAKVLMTARVDAIRQTERRWKAEVTLQAVEIATKRYLWIGRFTEAPAAGSGPKAEAVTSTPWPLNVDVSVRAGDGAEAVADELETYARGRLADLGYRVGTDQEADLELALEPVCELFDREGQWRTYNGTLRASLSAQGTEKHVIGETTLATKGTPGVGDADGRRNLVYAMESQLGAWMNRTLKPDAAEFAAVALDVMLADPVETGKDRAGIVEIRKALEGLPGVRRVTVAAQDDAAGQVSYKVVYKPADVPDGVANALFAAHPELTAYLP
jgi:hypothetical protein